MRIWYSLDTSGNPRRISSIWLGNTFTPASRILHKSLRSVGYILLRIPDENGRVSVGYPGSGAEENRRPIFFGKIKSLQYHFIGFLRSRRIKNRHLGKGRKAPGILFRLRGNGTGIIRHKDNQAAFYAEIGQAHQRISSHIQPHLLHGNHSPGSGKSCPSGHLHGCFFID